MDNRRNVFGVVGMTEDAALIALKASGVDEIILFKKGQSTRKDCAVKHSRVNLYIEDGKVFMATRG